MVIRRDKLLHIGLGILWLMATAVSLLVFAMLGWGPALAYGTTVFSLLYELNQYIRKEGQVEFWDFVCTALPGWVAWAVLEFV